MADRSRYYEDDFDRDNRSSSNRGDTSQRGLGSSEFQRDPERHRRIASIGGRSSQGGRDRNRDDQNDARQSWGQHNEDRSVREFDYNPEYEHDEPRAGGWEDEDEGQSDSGYSSRQSNEDDDFDNRNYSSQSDQSRSDDGRRSQSRRDTRDTSDTSRRGFASMDPEKRRRIAAAGGRASHGGGRSSGNRSTSGKQGASSGRASSGRSSSGSSQRRSSRH